VIRYLTTYVVYPLLEKHLGRDVRSKLRVLKEHFKKPFEDRKAYLRRALVRQLQVAESCVPYYQELFKTVRFDLSRVERDLKYLEDLPLLSKEIIMEQGDRMLNSRLKKEHFIVAKTGGSTGPTMLVYYTQDGADWASAVNQLVQGWAGRKRYQKELRLASRFPEEFPLRDRVKEHIKCFAMNRSNIFTHSFDDADMEVVWRKLRRRRPCLMHGHPSTVYALASYLERVGRKATGVMKVFESTGEVLDRKKREKIEKVFGCRCVNRYGNAEFGVTAYGTRESHGKLKVVDYVVYPECIESGDGKGGEIVLSGLTNDAMPLIRYQTGDLANLEAQPDGFYYENIQGRVHDIVRIGEKTYPTHYIQDLLDRIGGIDEFQVEQMRSGKLVLRLVPSNGVDTQALEGRIRSWWGEHVSFEFTDFERFKRVGWQGKFRYLVQ
jgi:phenylacetate-coenzyme A ligase PaaK-like adenylate-forming protein